VSVADDLKWDSGCRPWVAVLAENTARNGGVSVHAMIRERTPKATAARLSLCRTLIGRGWSPDVIERHFGMPHGWAIVPTLPGSREWADARSASGSGEHPVVMLPPPMTAEEKREDQRRQGLWPVGVREGMTTSASARALASAVVPAKPWMQKHEAMVEAADEHAASGRPPLTATVLEHALHKAVESGEPE
jgi:hypothetical protein